MECYCTNHCACQPEALMQCRQEVKFKFKSRANLWFCDFRLNSHGTRWQCTAKTFYHGVFSAYRLKLTWVMYFQCPKNSIRGLENAISDQFRFISGEISAKKIFLGHIYITKRFAFEFQGKSLEPCLSYRAHFRRYQHLRGFRQSSARSYRDC